jgi:L-aminopeptidase/D-esterase-like protein
MGLARAGSYGSAGSGEIGMAFSTSQDGEVDNEEISPLFAAAYECAWEAVMNCLVAASPAERLDGTMQDAFPVDRVRELVRAR